MRETTHETIGITGWSRTELLLLKVLGTAAVTLLAILSAQVKIFLPFTPVPVTLQTFVAPLAGGFLGAWYGGISMLLYVGLGLLGAPVFAQATGGWQFLYAPTAGFLVGMIGAAWIVGVAQDRRFSHAALLATLIASHVFLYACGTLGFMLSTQAGFSDAIAKAVAPFLMGDTLKIAATYLVLVSYNRFRKVSHL